MVVIVVENNPEHPGRDPLVIDTNRMKDKSYAHKLETEDKFHVTKEASFSWGDADKRAFVSLPNTVERAVTVYIEG